MTHKYTLGIDFGTLSGRAVVADTADGRELASAVREYAHGVMDTELAATGEKLPPAWALQDPQDYLDVMAAIVPEAIAAAGISPADVIAVGLDFTTCTVLPILEDGTPLCSLSAFRGNKNAYVKLWKHHAAQPYADRINELYLARGDRWMDDVSGGKISSESYLPKAWQTYTEAPEVYRAAEAIVDAADFMTLQLTGQLTRNAVIAGYKAGYRPETGFPPRSFLRECDPALESLYDEKFRGELRYPGECAGYVTAAAAGKFGLPAGIPVATGMPDAHVGGYAVGVSGNGDTFGIFGTSNCYFTSTPTCRPIRGVCGVVQGAMYPGYYTYEAGLCCFGDHFAWVAEKITPEEYKKEAAAEGISVLQLLIRKAAALRPGESGLLALDWWNGNRNVLVNNELSGMLLGLTLRTKPEEILRALIEATAFGTRVIFDMFRENGVTPRRFIAAGGVPRKDPFTMQLFADVLGMQIDVSSTRQAGALGSAVHAATVAGKAAGGYDTLEEAMAQMHCPLCATYTPDAAAGAVYDRLYAEYRRLHDYFGRGENDVMMRLRKIHG